MPSGSDQTFLARHQGPLDPPLNINLRFFSLVLGQLQSVYQILRFYDTGKCFTPYFAWHQKPLALTLDRNFRFRNLSFGFVVNPTTVQNFSFVGSLQVHMLNLWDTFRGPWLRPWKEISGFRNISYGFVVSPITIQNFNFVGRPSGNKHISPGSRVPGSVPGQKFEVFLFSFRAITINIPNFTLLR